MANQIKADKKQLIKLEESITNQNDTKNVIGLGMALGIVWGVSLGNIGLGLMIGIVIGSVLKLKKKRKNGFESSSTK